jgi:hypothetical protein
MEEVGTIDLVECLHCHVMIAIEDFNEHVDICERLHVFSDEMMASMMLLTLGGSTIDEYELFSQIGEMIGKVEVGVQDISAVLSPVDAQPPNCSLCPICFDDMSESTKKIVTTLCGHQFCEACVRRWLEKNKRCPVCMLDLEDMLAQMLSKELSSKSIAAMSVACLSTSVVP